MFSIRNYRSKIFLAYSTVLLIFALVVSIPMYYYLKHNIQQNIQVGSEQIIINNTAAVDRFYEKFNNISTQLYLNSDAAGNTVLNYLSSANKTPEPDGILQIYKSVNNFL
ncbi:MAG TPA: hypothetical protein VGE40_14275, partial [Bacilli bacterium]